MNDIYSAAVELQSWFDKRAWQNCVIGGLAVIRWGRRRTTVDADFSLLTGFGDEHDFVTEISAVVQPRYPGEVEFARRNRVYRGVASNGVPIDVGLAAFPFEEGIIDRARPYRYDSGHVLRVCELHDLIVMKAFAGRDQDWADLQYLVSGHRRTIDWQKVDGPLEELCSLSENFTSVPRLDELRHRIEQVTRDS